MIHCTDPKLTMSALDQKLNRSGTGMLLYFLSKHSQPDISNSVHELSKVLDSATPSALKELLRIIKFFLNTKRKGLWIEPDSDNIEKPWVLVCFSDSDYAGDPDSRRSISGFILYVRGVPICWRPRHNKT
jgi:hypothetical protein